MTQDKALEILKSGANVFLTGEPGAGKTYTINQFCDWAHDEFKNVAMTASTGIAATHINGKTIHSWSKIGRRERITDRDIEEIMSSDYAVRQMVTAKILVIDEISMIEGQTLNNIDEILRHVRGTVFTQIPFGGLQVVFVGDFFQLPPVAKGKKTFQFAFESDAWKAANPTVCYLTEQHRQSDAQFLDILTAFRQGKLSDKDKKVLTAERIVDEEGSTKLFTHNDDVDELNENKLAEIDSPEREFRMEEEGQDFIVQILKKNCISPELLKLKIGALVMFTRNNQPDGFVNGTQGRIVGWDGKWPVVHTTQGVEVIAKPMEWSMKRVDDSIEGSIRQIPLKLAWAITVHKSQGMSLDAAIVDLSGCFEFGQGYVAISRVRTLEGLQLVGVNPKAFKLHPRVVDADEMFREESEAHEELFGTVNFN